MATLAVRDSKGPGRQSGGNRPANLPDMSIDGDRHRCRLLRRRSPTRRSSSKPTRRCPSEGSPPSESYLRIDRLIEAARQTGADAVHPGYGFLAENPDFARAVIDAGLTWIGPSPEAMAAMGSKLESKRLVGEAGVPTLPSVDLTGLRQRSDPATPPGRSDTRSWSRHRPAAGAKACGSSERPDDLLDAVDGARREAGSAFGDDTVFLERHLVAAAAHRDPGFRRHPRQRGARCSSVSARFSAAIRRSSRKPPRRCIDDATREQMGEAAVAAARSVGYVGAGTVEFLYDGNQFFFLEMNTRLQVEHAVTEEITSLDLVRLQLLVAQGEALPEDALNPAMVGHAIEARLYAEDPLNDFLPVAGRLDRFEFPSLPGLRVDSGVESGSEVSPFYDPMIAKVVAWAETRQEAAALLARGSPDARESTASSPTAICWCESFATPSSWPVTPTPTSSRGIRPADLGGSLPDADRDPNGGGGGRPGGQAERRASSPHLLASVPSGWRNSPSQLQEVTFDVDGSVIKVGYRFEARGGVTIALDDEPIEDVALIELDGGPGRPAGRARSSAGSMSPATVGCTTSTGPAGMCDWSNGPDSPRPPARTIPGRCTLRCRGGSSRCWSAKATRSPTGRC